MYVLALFDTVGIIFGVAMLLGALLALFLCVRASSWARNRPASRVALLASLLPLAAGVCGAIAGFALWSLADHAPADNSTPWWPLGKACLAGLVVTLIPLLWSSLLLRLRDAA